MKRLFTTMLLVGLVLALVAGCQQQSEGDVEQEVEETAGADRMDTTRFDTVVDTMGMDEMIDTTAMDTTGM